MRLAHVTGFLEASQDVPYGRGRHTESTAGSEPQGRNRLTSIDVTPDERFEDATVSL
jgi:hypothetical protein